MLTKRRTNYNLPTGFSTLLFLGPTFFQLAVSHPRHLEDLSCFQVLVPLKRKDIIGKSYVQKDHRSIL